VGFFSRGDGSVGLAGWALGRGCGSGGEAGGLLTAELVEYRARLALRIGRSCRRSSAARASRVRSIPLRSNSFLGCACDWQPGINRSALYFLRDLPGFRRVERSTTDICLFCTRIRRNIQDWRQRLDTRSRA